MNRTFLQHQLETKPMTPENIDDIGFMLEEKGMSHSQIDMYFLNHHGLKGMKWNVRRQKVLATNQGRQKRQRNGAFQVDKLLKSIGGNVV